MSSVGLFNGSCRVLRKYLSHKGGNLTGDELQALLDTDLTPDTIVELLTEEAYDPCRLMFGKVWCGGY